MARIQINTRKTVTKQKLIHELSEVPCAVTLLGDTRLAQSVIRSGQGASAVGLGGGCDKTRWILGRGQGFLGFSGI